MPVNVMIPVAGGIQDKQKRRALNMVKKTSQFSTGGEGDSGRTLTGRVFNDPRVDPMAGETPFTAFIPTYNIADTNEGCMPIQLMASMIEPRVINPCKDLQTGGMYARSFPVNGARPSMAFTQFDLDNQDTASKRIVPASIYDQISSKSPFSQPKGNLMITN